MAIILNSENTAKRTSNRKYYLVDFNSVKAEGLDGIEKLSADDNVIVFFVKGESTVDFSLLSKFHSCSANVTMKEIERKDLINLVIVAFIGSIINENPDICLICRDGKNYVKAVELAVGRQLSISVQQNISGVVISPPPSPASEEISLWYALEPFDLSKSEISYLQNLVKKAKEFYSNRGAACQYLYNEIMLHSPRIKHKIDIYNAIKRLI